VEDSGGWLAHRIGRSLNALLRPYLNEGLFFSHSVLTNYFSLLIICYEICVMIRPVNDDRYSCPEMLFMFPMCTIAVHTLHYDATTHAGNPPPSVGSCQPGRSAFVGGNGVIWLHEQVACFFLSIA
jgi:hypothetical protein